VTIYSTLSLIKKEIMFKKMVFVIAFMPMFITAQHIIKGTFSPAEDYKYAILYKVTPESSSYIANTQVDEKGNFEFQLDSTVTKGMYRLVYALPQEEFNFDIIYNGKEDVLLTFDAETGASYQSSIENTLVNSYTKSMSLVSSSIGNFFRQKSKDSLALAAIFKTQRETQNAYEIEAEGTIALHFIKANEPYIPETFEDITTYIDNLKMHFFDHVDFNNETLQSSSFLIERSLNYVFGMAAKGKDEIAAYKKNTDELYLAMRDASTLIKCSLLEVLWQQMVDANFESVANYISEAYLIEIARSLNDTELEEGLKLFKSVSIGNKAPQFSLEVNEDKKQVLKSLYEINTAAQYVIVFWSSTCSHCLEEIPQLQTYVNGLKEGQLQVIAIGLEDEPSRWKNETIKYPSFMHVLGLGKWDNEIGRHYNVTATPTYYVLDRDKNIIAKPYDFQAFTKFMEQKVEKK